MTWVRVDDAMPLHPKVLPLTDGAFRAHVEAMCHSARSLTNGHVAAKIAKAHHWTKRAGELVEASLWEVVEDGWVIHDYLKYNPSREQVEAEREAAKGRMAKARSVRRSHSEFDGSSPEQPPNFGRSSGNPVPSRPDPELPTEVLRDTDTARAREGPRLLAPRLTAEQSSVLDALHEQVQRLLFAGSSAPPTGWCEDLVSRGATLADVSHAVQRTLEHGVRGNGTLRYVTTVLKDRVEEREAGRDPDARPEVGGGATRGGGDHAGARGGPRVRGGGARDPGPGRRDSDLPDLAAHIAAQGSTEEFIQRDLAARAAGGNALAATLLARIKPPESTAG